jgi:predicted lipoprotein with Yx(FWY)xxD motif
MRGLLIRGLLPLLLVTVGGVGAAMAAVSTHARVGTVRAIEEGGFGKVLVAANGHTLYRFTPDGKGVNRCSSVPACNQAWPPLLVKAGAKPTAGAGAKAALIGTIRFAHGKRQVTYAGFPLYFFAGDARPGQVNGEGVAGKWFVVGPSGALVRHAMKAGGSSSSGSGGSTTTSGSTGWG